MTNPTETLQRIPLAKLYVAPENARFGSKDLGDLDALAASIVEVGDLIDPLHVYGPNDDGTYGVWDGGRRWNALMKLVKGKKAKIPEALKAGVPCLVSESRESAMILSQATFVREAMHPADEFLHYRRLFLTEGLSHERIAAVCAVPVQRVRQLLRMIAVAPEIMEAFKAGDLSLDAVEAFTLSTDHGRQLAVLEALRKSGRDDARWFIKQAFKREAMDADDFWPQLVGREAYEAAGGTFLVDLFDDDEAWADGALVRQLGEAKIAALVDELKAEGWGFVEFKGPEARYGDWKGNREELREPEGGYSDEFKAEAGVVIRVNYQDRLEVRRGIYNPRKAEGAKGAAAAKPDQALYGFSHHGHYTMTHVAAEAVRVALAVDPGAAYDALLSHLAWITLRRDHQMTESTASLLVGDRRVRILAVEGSETFEALMRAWDDRLPKGRKPEDRVAFCEAVAALTPEDKAALLAVCFADTVEANEGRWDMHQAARWAHLGWMGRRAKVNIAAAWTPSADFLKPASKDALIDAATQLGASKDTLGGKKSGLVAFVANRAKEQGWVPKLLRDLFAAPEAPAAPKAEKPAKGARKGRGGLAAVIGEGTYQPAPEGVPPVPAADQDDGEEFSPALRRLAGPLPAEAQAEE